jgi:lipopolysaccharide export system ATP-binding protein
VGLLGPNGAGKTTSFYMVVGLIKPDQGEVFLEDVNITKLPMYKRAQMGIGYLPQEASVFRKLSVEDNIAAVLEMTRLSRREQKEKLESLIKEFRLQHVRKNNGDILSGGERRRTEIARALAVNPKFILLDEPFAGIDPIAVEDIQAIVARLKFKNIGILITDHNVTETLSICDRAYLLIEGRIYQHGTAEELAADEQVRKLYLGKNFELKRKDYLYEEARGNRTFSVEKMIQIVESGIDWAQRIDVADKARLKNIAFDHLSTDESAIADLQLDDYSKFLLELKLALIRYGTENDDQEISTRADQLLKDDRSIYTELNTILLYLKKEKG